MQADCKQHNKEIQTTMKKSNIMAAFALAGAAFTMTACSTTQELNGEWNVTSIEGNTYTPAEDQTAAFMGFDTKQKRMFGSAGCNRIFGSLNTKGHNIDFGAVGSTRMMCADMKGEDAMLKALQKVKKYQVEGGSVLTLKAEDGTPLIVLKKK